MQKGHRNYFNPSPQDNHNKIMASKKENQDDCARDGDNLDNIDVPPKPPRPYTAYHIFFQLERNYILQNSDSADQLVLPDDIDVDTVGRPERYRGVVMPRNWFISGQVRSKRDRQVHGVISFIDLTKTISQRWNSADSEVKQYCKDLAKKLLQRYHADLADYVAKYGKVAVKTQSKKQKAISMRRDGLVRGEDPSETEKQKNLTNAGNEQIVDRNPLVQPVASAATFAIAPNSWSQGRNDMNDPYSIAPIIHFDGTQNSYSNIENSSFRASTSENTDHNFPRTQTGLLATENNNARIPNTNSSITSNDSVLDTNQNRINTGRNPGWNWNTLVSALATEPNNANSVKDDEANLTQTHPDISFSQYRGSTLQSQNSIVPLSANNDTEMRETPFHQVAASMEQASFHDIEQSNANSKCIAQEETNIDIRNHGVRGNFPLLVQPLRNDVFDIDPDPISDAALKRIAASDSANTREHAAYPLDSDVKRFLAQVFEGHELDSSSSGYSHAAEQASIIMEQSVASFTQVNQDQGGDQNQENLHFEATCWAMAFDTASLDHDDGGSESDHN